MTVRVFTNGCFDILHPGHVDLLRRARELGDHLTVGLNSDRSVRQIKGNGRPINSQQNRKAVLAGLRFVDEVIIFDELTPEQLIKDINPDVLVKGGDWAAGEIIGADHVEANGGRVVSLPLVEGFSSTSIVERMTSNDAHGKETTTAEVSQLQEHIDVIAALEADHRDVIQECGELLLNTFRERRKVLICGNGGSAADAQHIAAEFVGRYEVERKALPAIALTTDTSALTALANDYDFDQIFARQVEALGSKDDCLIAISTSGNSPNVIAAVMAARKVGMKVLGMTGSGGKKLASLCDQCLMVPSGRTSRVQEAHITVAHIWCETVESAFKADGTL
jgi:D-sedoheptulose 7-phosphate isomerase